MWRRIVGWIVFVWFTISFVGASRDVFAQEGVRRGTTIGAAIFCGAVALVGLAMALGKDKPNEQPPAS